MLPGVTVSYQVRYKSDLPVVTSSRLHGLRFEVPMLVSPIACLTACLSGVLVRDKPFLRAFEEHRRGLLLDLNGLLPFVDGTTLVPGPFVEYK
jgi:hypothetical protein